MISVYVHSAVCIFSAAISILLGFCVLMNSHSQNTLNRYFLAILSCALVLALAEFASWYYEGMENLFAFISFVHFLLFFIPIILVWLFSRYLFVIINEKEKVSRYWSVIIAIPAVTASVLLVINQFNHMLYSISSDGWFVIGDWFILYIISPVCAMVLCSILPIRFRKQLGKDAFVLFSAYSILAVAFLALQLMPDDTLFGLTVFRSVSAIFTMIILLLFGSVQSQIGKRLSDSLLEANKAKVDFLSKMSHELLTPMNSVIGMTEIALRDMTQETKDEHIREVRQAGENLLSIINEILDVSEDKAGIREIVSQEDADTSADTGDYTVSFTAPSAKVLLVDDIDINLMVAEGSLAPYKMRVELCSSGLDAVEAVHKVAGCAEQYDLVIMDYMMPGIDGAEATRRIREFGIDIPIIALTANTVPDVTEMLLDSGFTDYMYKPIDVVKLDTILEKWIPKEKQHKS